MAISFVGSHVGTHAATSAQSVNFSSLLNEAGGTPTVLEDDIVFVAVENSSTVDRGDGTLVPSTYTPAHTADYRNDANDSNFQVSFKVMGATPDTSVSIPASNATTAGVGYAIFVFRGVDTTTPQDTTTLVTGAINTGKANPPAIEPVTSGAWIAVFAGAAVAAGAVFSNAGDLSATANHFRSATITTTTNDANIGAGLKTDWAAGPFDPAIFGGSTTTNTGSWSAVSVALRPVQNIIEADANSSGTGAATGNSGTIIPGLAAATGAGAATGVSLAIVTSEGAAAGAATGTGLSGATVSAEGLSSGSGAAAGLSASIGPADAASVGASTAAGVSSATVASVAASQGASTAAADAEDAAGGSQIVEATASSAGSSAANSDGAAVFGSDALASGEAAVTAEAAAFSTGVALSAGFGVAVGAGSSIAAAVANAAGLATALGVWRVVVAAPAARTTRAVPVLKVSASDGSRTTAAQARRSTQAGPRAA